MLKVRFFLNEPNGKPWKNFIQMMPRLGEKYKDIEIEVTSKPIAEYNTDEYFELELPVAPAVMVGDEIVVEGSNVSQDKVEAAICRQLGLPEPEPQKKGIFDRLLGRWLMESVSWQHISGNNGQTASPIHVTTFMESNRNRKRPGFFRYACWASTELLNNFNLPCWLGRRHGVLIDSVLKAKIHSISHTPAEIAVKA